VLSVLLGVEAVLVVSLGLSAILLGERAEGLAESVRQLAGRVSAEHEPNPALPVALEILQVRSQRIDWAPKLAALSGCIDNSLRLGEAHGQTKSRDREAQLELRGLIRGRDPQVEVVSRFVEALQEEPRIAEEFGHVQLGTIEGADRFHIICRPAGGGGP